MLRSGIFWEFEREAHNCKRLKNISLRGYTIHRRGRTRLRHLRFVYNMGLKKIFCQVSKKCPIYLQQEKGDTFGLIFYQSGAGRDILREYLGKV
jgi:hypothetical protein